MAEFSTLRFWFRTIPMAAGVLFVGFYLVGVVLVARDDSVAPPRPQPSASASIEQIAIFGASGTAGDGILKATMSNDDITQITVVTRRETPRMLAGKQQGKVQVLMHKDYLDYSAVIDSLAGVDAVYWAIGLSSLGVDEALYRNIHIEFPVQFLKQWLAANPRDDASFHYISSSDISEDSTAMWARTKVEAENQLFAVAEDTPVRVIAYRPDYIGPTIEEAHLGQKLLYAFFAPVGAAVKAVQIGQAMMELSMRGSAIPNGQKVGTRAIRQYSEAFEDAWE